MNVKIEKIKNVHRIVTKDNVIIDNAIDKDFVQKFMDKLDKPYAHTESTKLPLKNSVSVILSEFNKDNDFVKEEFLTDPMYQNAILESTELGIAYHSAMQCYDIGISDDNFMDKVKNSLDERQWDSIDESKILNAKAKLDKLTLGTNAKIYKEQKFMMYVPYCEVFVDSQVEDKFLIQGVVDLLIEYQDKVVLIDYKTNKTKNRELLRQEYEMQLKLYKMATELSFHKNVLACLYAFSVDDFIYL